MYPLPMHNPGACGYAVANDEAEHKALSEAGYLPPLSAPEATEPAEPAKRGPGRPRKADQ